MPLTRVKSQAFVAQSIRCGLSDSASASRIICVRRKMPPGPTSNSTMKLIYDKDADTLAIILGPGTVAESDEPRPGLTLDYDKSGRLVSIELLDASEQIQRPQSVEFALAGGP